MQRVMQGSDSSPEDRAALNAVAPNGTCPFCKHSEWYDVGVRSRGYVQVATGETAGGRFDTFTLVCTTCGFVRQHAVGVLGIEP